MSDISNNAITCIAIVCLAVVAVCVLVMRTDSFLLETIIVVIGGLAGYEIKGAIDNKTITELQRTIEDLRRSRT